MQALVHLPLRNSVGMRILQRSVDKICNKLKCDVGDIMEFVPDMDTKVNANE